MKNIVKKIIPKQFIHTFWHKPKAVIAAVLAGFPGQRLFTIAIAGTKGKTSTAYYLSHILDTAGIQNVLFSTGVIKIAGEESMNTLKLTTPTPFYLQNLLKRAIARKCTHAIIEVSSHALLQHRLWGVPLRGVVLTNLMPDHLEYHGDAHDYQETHQKLITNSLQWLVLNGDDSHLESFKGVAKKTTITGMHTQLAKRIRSIGIPIPGDFSIANVMAAVAAAQSLGISDATIEKSLRSLRGAPGRLESIQEGQPFDILVDYAHSVESLTTFFHAIRPQVPGRIIAVYGACGDRDPQQRPRMGKVLDELADYIFLTTDDPYSEDPEKIADQVWKGITQKKNGESSWRIPERRTAIQSALRIAQKGDCVCILGKGAEQWQVFNGTKIPWDDRMVVREELAVLMSHVRIPVQ